MTNNTITIDGRRIGNGAPPYVIAEIGINHGGKLDTALALLEKAKTCGVDAAKLQAFVPEKFLSRSSPYFDLLASCALDAAAVAALVERARELRLSLFSAVFDEESADLLQGAGVPAFKIASGDLTHLPLLRYVAVFGKPMLISTGGGTMDEIDAAIAAVRDANSRTPIALFHCVSNYPTQASDANLACMATMRNRFGVPVGFSDHTLGGAVSIAAAALGADMIEKHFTFDKAAPGPDHALSADPAEMTAMVEQIRVAFAAVGRAEKMPVEPGDFIPQMRRSVTAAVAISQGTAITAAMLEVKRPGTGIVPDAIGEVLGKKAARNIAADETLTWKHLV